MSLTGRPKASFPSFRTKDSNAVLSFPFSRVSVTASSFPIFYFPFTALRLLFLSSFSEHRAQVYLETVDLIRAAIAAYDSPYLSAYILYFLFHLQKKPHLFPLPLLLCSCSSLVLLTLIPFNESSD